MVVVVGFFELDVPILHRYRPLYLSHRHFRSLAWAFDQRGGRNADSAQSNSGDFASRSDRALAAAVFSAKRSTHVSVSVSPRHIAPGTIEYRQTDVIILS